MRRAGELRMSRCPHYAIRNARPRRAVHAIKDTKRRLSVYETSYTLKRRDLLHHAEGHVRGPPPILAKEFNGVYTTLQWGVAMSYNYISSISIYYLLQSYKVSIIEEKRLLG